MFFHNKYNKIHITVFSSLLMLFIVLNFFIPVFFKDINSTSFAQSQQSNSDKATNNTDRKLSKKQVETFVLKSVSDIIERSHIEATTIVSKDNTAENQLVLKYINDNKSNFINIYQKSISDGSSYRDAVGLVLSDIENKAGWEGKILLNGTKSQVINNLYANLGKLRGSLSSYSFLSKSEFTEQELTQALGEVESFATSNTADLVGACSSVSTLSEPFCLAIWYILEAIVGAFAGIAYIFIKIFESAVGTYILNISTLFQVKATSLGDGLADQNLIFVMWKMARDIVNVLVFFSAAYIGIRRILGDEGDFLKNIVRILMFAFLVNFSYPIAKFFIDISNISSLFVYKSIVDPNMLSDGSLADIILANIGFSFMSKIFGSGEAINITSNFASPSPWWSLVLVTFLSLTMLFVFSFLSIMIFIRAFVLIICVIFSPLMFAVGFVGKMDDLHKKWMDNFFNNIIFAPLMMLGLYIVLNILISSKPAGPAAMLQTEDIDALGRLMLALVGFLIVYYMSKVISGSIGGAVSNVLGKGLTTAGMFVGGGVIAGGVVKGAGAIMGRVASSKSVQNAANDNSSKFRRFAANTFIKSTDRVQNMKAGFGRFARSSTYSDDIKDANMKALNNNRDFLRTLSSEQRSKIIQDSKNIKYKGGQKQMNNILKSVSDIGPEFDKDGNIIRDRALDRQVAIEELTKDPTSKKLTDYFESDKKVQQTEYIQSKKDTINNVISKVSPSLVSNSKESVDKIRNLKIAKQNHLNDLAGRDRMRTVEEQNQLKEKLKTERAHRESARAKTQQEFLANNVEDISYRDSNDNNKYNQNNTPRLAP